VWSRDGRELFYRQGQQTLLRAGSTGPQTPQLFSIDISFDPAPRFSTERALAIEDFMVTGGREYDIMPDGSQFITAYAEESTGPEIDSRPQIRVVLNWLEELQQ
jgi:hypothetical protein